MPLGEAVYWLCISSVLAVYRLVLFLYWLCISCLLSSVATASMSVLLLSLDVVPGIVGLFSAGEVERY
jgi:uncharacterized membrane protein YccF (DUF307 family)